MSTLGSKPTDNMFSGGTNCSYLDLPANQDYATNDLAIVGVPIDVFTSGRSGARLGPRAIRTSSALISWDYPFGWNCANQDQGDVLESGRPEYCRANPLASLKLIDTGDLPFDFGRPSAIEDNIYCHFKEIVKNQCATMALGGDHYITYPILRAYAEYYGRPLAIIQFDAHSDLWQDTADIKEVDKRRDHGTMMAQAIQDKLIIPNKSVQLGIRTNIDDDLGMNIIAAPSMHQEGIVKSLTKALAIVKDEPVYLSFDMDFLDPAFAPGTGTPCPGGFSSAEALNSIRILAGINIVGADLVETAPPYDHAEITSLAAASITANILCLFATRNKGSSFK